MLKTLCFVIWEKLTNKWKLHHVKGAHYASFIGKEFKLAINKP